MLAQVGVKRRGGEVLTREDLREWVVYRLFKGEKLLYVGMSGDWPARLRTHLSHGVEFDRYELEDAPSKEAALALEANAIRDERPPLNSPNAGRFWDNGVIARHERLIRGLEFR